MSDGNRYTPNLHVPRHLRPRVVSDAWRVMRAQNSFRARRYAPSPNLGQPHSVPFVHLVGPRRSPIVSKKSSGRRSTAPCCYCVFCIYSHAVMGHGTSNTCPYKYRNSAIPFSVLRFFEGFRAVNRNPSPCKTSCLNADVALVGDTLVVLLGPAHWWDGAGLKITKQALKGHLIGIVIFPLEKVSDMSSPANIGCPRIGCILDGFIQRDGEEGRLSLVLFLFQRFIDFILYPRTVNGMLRKDDQEFIIEPYRLINAVSEFVSNFQIFRSKPAANVFALQIGIEPLGKLLILTGIADKAGVVLDRVLSQGTDIGNEGVGQASLTQECLRDVSFRPQEGICPDGRGATMKDGFQSLHRSQVNISKDCPSYIGSDEVSSDEVSSAEVGSAEVGFAEVGFAEVGFSEVGSAEVGSDEVGSTEVGSTEVGSAEVGYAEVGFAEVGSAEVGSAEVGFSEVGSAEVGFSEVGFAKTGSAEVGIYEVGFSEVGSAEVGSAEVGSAEVGIYDIGSAEVNENFWMLNSPCVPDFYSLLEKICFIFPSLCGGIHRGLHLIRLETRCLNADVVRGAL